MIPEDMRSTANRAGAQPPSTARRMLAIVAVAGLALLAWQLSDVFLLLFGAIILATALRALAAPLERYLRLSPRLAVATAVFLASAMIATGTWLIGDRLGEQFANLRQRVPEALAALTAWLNNHPIGLEILGIWDNAKEGVSRGAESRMWRPQPWVRSAPSP